MMIYCLFFLSLCHDFHERVFGDNDLFSCGRLDTCFGLLFQICPTFARCLDGYFFLLKVCIDGHDLKEKSPDIETGESLGARLTYSVEK